MVNVENRSFDQPNAEPKLAVQQRLKALSELGLLEAPTIPVFEAATQTAADFLEVPICILGFIDENCHWFKSAVGLSRLGLMNQLAIARSLPREESFCSYVVTSQQSLAINDTHNQQEPVARSVLVQRYGIRAYLGVPVMDFSGNCLGAIAIMDLQPRTFTLRDIKFLELLASWSMSEFERTRLLKTIDSNTGYSAPTLPPTISSSQQVKLTATSPTITEPLFAVQVKLELLALLTQELRTPLTSVLGMANVVGREIYGPLTSKQKEYIEIIQNSGQYLLSMVNEISELGTQDESAQELNLTAVDIEMLCQQAINTLSDAAKRREQQIRLSLEHGRSLTWILDKDKVRHLLYQLLFSTIQTSPTASVIHLHVSHSDKLNLTVSVSHPWLGAGLTSIDPCFELPGFDVSNRPQAEQGDNLYSFTTDAHLDSEWSEISSLPGLVVEPLLGVSSLNPQSAKSESESPFQLNHKDISTASNSQLYRSCETLRLLLSCHLAKLHGGQISVQGTAESGYRYIVSLPQLEAVKESS